MKKKNKKKINTEFKKKTKELYFLRYHSFQDVVYDLISNKEIRKTETQKMVHTCIYLTPGLRYTALSSVSMHAITECDLMYRFTHVGEFTMQFQQN